MEAFLSNEMVIAVLTPLVALILVKLNRWLSAQIGTQDAETQALLRAAVEGAFDTASKLAKEKNLAPDTAVDFIVAHVKASYPDALKKLDASDVALTNKAAAKLAD